MYAASTVYDIGQMCDAGYARGAHCVLQALSEDAGHAREVPCVLYAKDVSPTSTCCTRGVLWFDVCVVRRCYGLLVPAIYQQYFCDQCFSYQYVYCKYAVHCYYMYMYESAVPYN